MEHPACPARVEMVAGMSQVNIHNELWDEFLVLCQRLEIESPNTYLEQWLRHIVKNTGIQEQLYLPISAAIVTRNDAEILLVGNEYTPGKSLFWGLPGGAVEHGEDIRQAVIRELFEETGITTMEVGRLAWIVQGHQFSGKTGVFVFGFEISDWQGEITLKNEETAGPVKKAEFVPYSEAYQRLVPNIARQVRDWLEQPKDSPRIYWLESRNIEQIL